MILGGLDILTNGLTFGTRENVVLASSYDVCYACAMEEFKKTKDLAKAYKNARGKAAGKLMKRFPALKDRDGAPVLICSDCLEKFAKETTFDGQAED